MYSTVTRVPSKKWAPSESRLWGGLTWATTGQSWSSTREERGARRAGSEIAEWGHVCVCVCVCVFLLAWLVKKGGVVSKRCFFLKPGVCVFLHGVFLSVLQWAVFFETGLNLLRESDRRGMRIGMTLINHPTGGVLQGGPWVHSQPI